MLQQSGEISIHVRWMQEAVKDFSSGSLQPAERLIELCNPPAELSTCCDASEAC